MDKNLLIIMGLALLIVLPIMWAIISHIDKKDKIKTNTGFSLIKKSANSPIFKIYKFLMRLPFTRKYMNNLTRRYDILCPGDQKTAIKESVKTFSITAIVCLILSYFLFFKSPTLQGGIISVLMVYIINSEVTSTLVKSAERRLLKQIVDFISNVRHNYYIKKMVDVAISMSLDSCGKELKPHAVKLYEIVTSNNIKNEVEKYNAATNNKYLKMFLSLCMSVIEYKDKEINGQNLFAANLEHLKKEVNIELLKLDRIKHLFSGVIFVTIFPCLAIGLIKSFALDMMPQLTVFYDSKIGYIYIFATYLITVVIYYLLNQLRETKKQIAKDYRHLLKYEKIFFIKKALDNYTEKHYGKMLILKDNLRRIGETMSPRQFVLQRIKTSIFVFLSCLCIVLFLHANEKNNLLTKAPEVQFMQNPPQNAKTIETAENIIIELTNLYKTISVTKEDIANKISELENFKNTQTTEEMSEIISTRINKYDNEYFKWYELVICIAGGVIGFFIPGLILFYKKKIMQLSMEDEVNQFSSIVFMLMYIDHMTVKDILIELETFAVIFKQSLQECINEYNSGDIEALVKMKERESYEPFKRMVDNFIRCDVISIDKAFDEISSDRENYHDRRKQENEFTVQKKSDLAKPLSFVPAVLVIAYLIIPLMWASLQELSGFSETINIL